MSSFDVPVWVWALLAAIVAISISVDLLAHRGERIDSRKRALVWSFVWIGVSLAFNVFVAVQFGAAAGEEFLAVYLLEKSLAVDNLFVFLLVFGALNIPPAEQRRVLTWGIIGAILTRGVLVFAGAAAVARWHSLLYVFGGLLIVGAIKLLRAPQEESENKLLGWLERHIPWTPKLHGHHFFTRVSGRLLATPLLLALIAIELTDVVFAIDSVPAAFAVTNEPFLIYSSNLLAILGLRALYVVLAGAIADLRYLRFGLAGVLGFAGGKLLTAAWFTIPPLVSVSVIAAMIAIAVGFSVRANRRDRRDRPTRGAESAGAPA
ncbi:MAG: rane protein [Deltaproteobacteria bacterium]|nr:rane protein [Deltaproteobacteria bacterium]